MHQTEKKYFTLIKLDNIIAFCFAMNSSTHSVEFFTVIKNPTKCLLLLLFSIQNSTSCELPTSRVEHVLISQSETFGQLFHFLTFARLTVL